MTYYEVIDGLELNYCCDYSDAIDYIYYIPYYDDDPDENELDDTLAYYGGAFDPLCFYYNAVNNY